MTTPAAVAAFLLTALGGAVAAGLFALLGSWVQSRREHHRWIRERRYEAYLDAYNLLDEYNRVYERFRSARNDHDRISEMKVLDRHAVSEQKEVRAINASKELSSTLEALQEKLYAATVRVQLLGTKRVESALVQISQENRSGTDESRREAHRRFVKEARKVIHPRWFRRA